MVFIGVDLDQIDKMAPRRVKSASGPKELNQHFGAKTDLLDLECIDSNLTWKTHIKHITTKIAKTTGILFKARHFIRTFSDYKKPILLINLPLS